MRKLFIIAFILLLGCLDVDQQQNATQNDSIISPLNDSNQSIPVQTNDTNLTVPDVPEPPVLGVCKEHNKGVDLGEASFVNRCDGNKTVSYSCQDNKPSVLVSECEEGKVCLDAKCVILPCYDSDSGDFFKKGTAYHQKRKYNDSCEAPTLLKEYSCDGDKLLSQLVECDFVCGAGACVRKDYTCQDPDGQDIFNATSINISDGFSSQLLNDTCAGLFAVNEYYCNENGKEGVSVINCPNNYFCENSICIPEIEESQERVVDASKNPGTPNLDCTESDGGKEYRNSGTVHKANLIFTDKCRNRRTIEEYYCTADDKVVQVIDTCPGTMECIKGECR